MYFCPRAALIKILTVSTLCLFSPSTIANDSEWTESYESPPPKRVGQRRSVGSGSRSHCQNIFPKGALTLLVPEEKVVHYTTLANPNFYIYAQTTSKIPLEFTLVIPDPKVDNPIVQKSLTVEEPGVKQIKLPTDFKLKTGQTYLWHIDIPCKNAPQNISQTLKAAIERVPVNALLAEQLEQANSPSEKAEVYVNHGIWYDLLEQIEQNQDYSYLKKIWEKLPGNINS